MYKIARTEKQIDDVLNEALRLMDAGENPYFGQTYAEGVESALQWVLGNGGDVPPLIPEESKQRATRKRK